MIIQHNISALNSYNKLAGNNKALAKNLEKLSSGYKINRAADDAAGLGISEKMRAQITGMNRAQQNSKDGISLVQTAEGALTEVHSMLNRMVDLTTQASNGVYTNDEKTKIKDELAQLESEIDRIADATNFNGIKLLDGSLSGTGATKAVSSITTELSTTTQESVAGKYEMSAALDAAVTSGAFAGAGASIDYTISLDDGTSKTINIKMVAGEADATKFQLLVDGEKVGGEDTVTNLNTATKIGDILTKALNDSDFGEKFKVTNAAGKLTFEAKEKGTAAPSVTGVTAHGVNNTGAAADKADAMGGNGSVKASDQTTGVLLADLPALYTGTNAKDATFEINGKKFVIATDATDLSGLDSDVNVITAATKAGATDGAKIAKQIGQVLGMDVTFSTNAGDNGASSDGLIFAKGTSKAGSGGLRLQIGETNDDFNQLDVTVDDCHAAALGVAGLNIDTPDAAAASMMKAKAAIEQVSKTRSLLGATQNRLDHTLANLEETTTNLTEAESRIRDTDMANEMMKYTKNNILIQSSQAMLAQANQVPQGVLQLLQ